MVIGKILPVLHQLLEFMGLPQLKLDIIAAGMDTKIRSPVPGVFSIAMLREQVFYFIELQLYQG
jgi:hypothetical protein